MMAKPAKAARMALAAALVLFSGVSSATIPGEISNGMSKQLRRSPGQKNKSAKGELEGGTAVLLETGYSRGRRERWVSRMEKFGFGGNEEGRELRGGEVWDDCMRE
eukprot:292808-Amorphochlora_amoeboformis.AAC.2